MKFVFDHLNVKAATAQETADLLTLHTQEVESVQYNGVVATKVITGKIVDIQEHPNADRLRIVSVDVGQDVFNIITAAPNVQIDQVVAVALPGAKVVAVDHKNQKAPVNLSQFMTIQKTEMRGVSSDGMLCGADELGLSDVPVAGVHVFPPDTPIGIPVEEIIPTSSIIETDDKGTAHRPDLLSYAGIEQELAAILSQPYSREMFELPKQSGSSLQVSIEAKRACDVFLVARIDHMKQQQTPKVIAEFLKANDVKTINLATDITNYCMLREGYPTHAFDTKAVEGNKISVRFARKGEEITALNHQTYRLSETDLVLADAQKILDLAGIIGGASTGVQKKSSSVILTAAVFDPAVIRKSSRKLGVRTEAAARNERGLSLALAQHTFSKAIDLICQYSGGSVIEFHYDGMVEDQLEQITISPTHLNSFLGTTFSIKEIESSLRLLNYKVVAKSDLLMVSPPWWRSDVHLEADVYEDVARIAGYNTIPLELPHLHNKKTPESLVPFVQNLRRHASAYWYEVNTSHMVSDVVKNEYSFEIANPIGDKRYMRQGISPGLVDLTRQRIRDGYIHFGCFEIGSVFFNYTGKLDHYTYFSGCIPEDPEEVKGKLGVILHHAQLNVEKIRFVPTEGVPGESSAYIHLDKEELGQIFCKSHHGKFLTYFELDATVLANLSNSNPTFSPYSKYPSIRRDIAITLTQKIALGDVVATIQASSPLIIEVSLFDRLNNEGSSVAFHITFQSPSRTLRDQEVNEIMKHIESNLINKYNATIR